MVRCLFYCLCTMHWFFVSFWLRCLFESKITRWMFIFSYFYHDEQQQQQRTGNDLKNHRLHFIASKLRKLIFHWKNEKKTDTDSFGIHSRLLKHLHSTVRLTFVKWNKLQCASITGSQIIIIVARKWNWIQRESFTFARHERFLLFVLDNECHCHTKIICKTRIRKGDEPDKSIMERRWIACKT